MMNWFFGNRGQWTFSKGPGSDYFGSYMDTKGRLVSATTPVRGSEAGGNAAADNMEANGHALCANKLC